MSSRKNFLTLKSFRNSYWKNNYINNYNYSNFFFQFNLIKYIVNFFFLNTFTTKFLKKKNFINKNIYISQIWINSINNSIIISFNLYVKKLIKKDFSLSDNYIRLKYLNKFFYNNIIV